MEDVGAGVRWAEFAAQAESLGADIGGLVEQYRFALIGTIRRDGTPRISPVETHLVHGDFMVVMIPRTRKATDIQRDDRVTLQSPIVDAGNPGAEYKLRGRARIVEDADVCKAAADVVESQSGWRPRRQWVFVAILLYEATHTLWKPDGTALMTRWTSTDGVETRSLRLDMDFGGYRVG
jgi:predicted pyridoxine 5'-phosphate oxidase superfamily flavin-nucleotide-binding protein